MIIHLALFCWEKTTHIVDVEKLFSRLQEKMQKQSGIIEFFCTRNQSQYNERYTHVIYAKFATQEALDAYRKDPLHRQIAKELKKREEKSIGVDMVV